MKRLIVRGAFLAAGLVATVRLVAHPDSVPTILTALAAGTVAFAYALEAWTWGRRE